MTTSASPCVSADSGTRADSRAFSLDLRRQAIFSVADAANVRIACAEGSVWITLDNDPRDIVLEACEVFTTQEYRRAIIYAMTPSRITVAAGAAPVAQRRPAAGLVLQMQPA